MSTLHSFTLTHKVAGPFEMVYNSLFDFTKFGELHPYMKEVNIHVNRSPEYVEYAITEELMLFGFIRNRPEYKARVIEVKKNHHIQYISQVKKNIHLTIDLIIHHQEKGIVTVEEKIKIKGNKIIAIIFAGILKKAHLLFFETLGDEAKKHSLENTRV